MPIMGQNAQIFQLLTWNVRGLNDSRKVRRVGTYLKRHSVAIAVLQETHLAPGRSEAVHHKLHGVCYSSDLTSHARWVLIWVDKKAGVEMTGILTDPQGRYAAAVCKRGALQFLLVSIYGPNHETTHNFIPP